MKMCKMCGESPAKPGRASKYCDECTSTGYPSQTRVSHQTWKFNVDVEKMDRDQGGRCAICGSVNPDGRRLAVDHDHACCPGKRSCGGCVRGLLCDRCNRGMGFFGDDPALLESAAEYLRNGVKY